jgi:lysophospholipase L1-like esterase
MKSPFIGFGSLLLGFLALAAQAGSAHAEGAAMNAGNDRETIRVACVGDSITAGVGAENGWDYPAQLGRMIGPKWTVLNFGVSGSTLLNKGDKPYQKQGAFMAAQNSKPNVVVILLGANDSKPQNWAHKQDFYTDFKELVGYFEALDTRPRIYLCHPCPVPGTGNYGINEAAVAEEIPIIDRLAGEKKVTLINIHDALAGHPEFFPDRVHPNRAGATAIARTVYLALTGKKFEGAVPSPAPSPPNPQ